MKLLGKAISGTCGARTYSVGGAGVTARQKTCPVNKNSLAQARRRGLFAAAGAAFKSLTTEQRAELHARALAASDTDIFGKKITLSDYAFFLREWMRGIRPAPREDLSIIALNEFRKLSWTMQVASPLAVGLTGTGGQLSDEVWKSGTRLMDFFSLTLNTGEVFVAKQLAFLSSAKFIVGSTLAINKTIEKVQFIDSLGRVFTF